MLPMHLLVGMALGATTTRRNGKVVLTVAAALTVAWALLVWHAGGAALAAANLAVGWLAGAAVATLARRLPAT